MKLPGVLKDKKVQIAAAAAAALGLLVLVMRGGGGATAGGGADGSGSSLNTGTLDSTGTDNYAAVAQLGQAWQDQWNDAFKDFSDQLTDINTTLGGIKPPVTTIPSGGTKVTPVNPAYAVGRGWVKVKPGQTVASIAKQYHTTEAAIRSFNSANALNRFSPGETIRIRGAAGPKPPGSK